MLQLALAIGLVAVILGVGFLVRGILAKRSQELVGLYVENEAVLPVILYFKSPSCPPCRLDQEPELQRLTEHSSDKFELRTIDVSQEPEVARAYRVLSAPTTVVLDSTGRVAAVNVGAASEKVLAAQIVALGESAA